MPDLGILSPTVATTILTLGLALVVAAIIGGGIEAMGNNIPVITGWKRQVATGLFGVLLVGFGWEALQAANWRAGYMDLVAGMSAVPPFPTGTVEDRLNTLANDAGDDQSRNCLIADFIFDHNVELPISVKQRLIDAKTGNVPALTCYLQIEQQAASQLTPASSGSSATSDTIASVPTPAAQPGAPTIAPAAPVPASTPTPAGAQTLEPVLAPPPVQHHSVQHEVSISAQKPSPVAVAGPPGV
ncbi:MAG TPA: hypothetical protein VHT05_02290, partial [Candidatus Elarobacter sp.]|nr:hypothetical protein [Candidatus Elarobacter sp.]